MKASCTSRFANATNTVTFSRSTTARIVLALVFISFLVTVTATAAPPTTGKFVAADFTPPDYADGDFHILLPVRRRAEGRTVQRHDGP